jgi:hypothetical protein
MNMHSVPTRSIEKSTRKYRKRQLGKTYQTGERISGPDLPSMERK